ncbi:hypothetical protein, partial [Acetobacter syzygii]|uniref:hypothetical protein n=1 Tax=Acetobacter syzygii TaxID=146476 RepID=UPI0039EAC1CA
LPRRRRSCSSCVSAFCANADVPERRDKARDTKMVFEKDLFFFVRLDGAQSEARQGFCMG